MKKFLFSVMALFVAVTLSFAQTALPYTTGFEDAEDNALWQFDNGSNANAWVIGEAVNNGGTHALYLSNDGGLTNAYSHGEQLSIAYRSFAFTAGEYTISFDCQGNGETTWDGMEVFLVPESVTPVSAAASSATWGDLTVSRNAPTAADIETAGWFRAVDPTPYSSSSAFFFSKHTTWETGVPFGVTIPAAGNYKLVFVWLNDGSGGSQPAAAVDNLSIQPKLCGDMGAIAVNNITETTADISFATIDADQYQVVVLTANVSPESAEAEQIVYNNTAATLTRTATGLTANTPYYVYVRAVCGENFGVYASTSFRTECGSEDIPYTNGFESDASGTVPNCWTRPEALSYPKIYAYSFYTGSQCLYYCGGGSTSDQIVMLPNFSQAVNTLMISFYYKATVGSSNGVPQVGYVTDKSDVTTFVALDTLDQQSGWESYEFALAGAPATATNIAIRYSGGTSNYGYFYLDDLTVKAIPNCMKPATLVASDRTVNGATLTWTAGGSETNFEYVVMPAGEEADWTLAVATDQLTVTLTTLTVDTDYDFYVRAACGETEKSEARSTAFSTLGYCKPAPTSVDKQGMIAVALGGVEQTTAVHATAAPYYTNNSNLTFEVAASTATSIDVTYATGYTYGTVIWVDWNNDMDFTVDEVVFAGTSASTNPTTLNCPFTVPATQPEGTYRLRIGGADSFFDNFISGSTTTANSCSSGTYLVYEDYSITVLAAPSCLQPTNVTVIDSTITASSATLTCVAGGSETNWYVSYKAAADEDWTIVLGAVDTPYVLNGLNANTAYQVRMAAVCGNDTSEWSTPVAFRTGCGAESMPYADDFENGIYCWTVGNAQSTSATYIPSVSSTYKRTGNNGLHIYAYVGGSVNADSAYAILPAMDYGTPGLTGYTLKFYARSSSTSSSYYKHLFVGVVTDPNDISTFELVQDVEVTADTYAEQPFEVILGSYAGTGARLALLTTVDPTASGYRYGHIYVDDISIVRTPTCQPLAKIEATNETRRSITVTLTPKAGLDLGTYDLVCSTTELDAAALEAATKTVVTDTNMYAITGLNRETPYYIYVRANCGEGDVSTWVSTSATTKGLLGCDDITVGTGTSAGNNPVTNYNYAYAQLIYAADDIAHSGNISSIQLQRSTYANVMNNMKVYIGTTDKTAFTSSSDWVPAEDLTLVYEGAFEAGSEWLVLPFTAPFAYDGTSNIVVAISNGHGNWNSIQNFRYTTVTNTLLVNRSDDDASYANHPGTAAGQTPSSNRTNIRFSFCYDLDPCPAVTDMAFELLGDGTTEARVTWTTADADYLSAYEYVRSTVEITDFSGVTGTPLPATATSIEFNDLQPETTYYVYIRAICEAEGHEEGSSNWVGIDTTTNANCPTLNGLALNLKANNAFEASWNTAFEGQALSFRYILSTTELDAAGIAAAEPALADTNVIELTELLNDQMYYFYVASACGASTSAYIVDSIKTLVACQAVQNLTAARVEHNLVLITWNKAPFATETAWEIGFVGDEENAIVVDTTMHMFIGLTAETDYNVYVKALCSETSESAIATVSFTTGTQPSNCATVGTGTSSAYLLYTSYGNTYSQHIYTAEELAALGYGAGTINSVAFDYSGTSSTYEKTQSVYIGTTTQTSFTGYSATDFIGDLTLVYGPTLLSYEAGWREYTFETPFVWDGTSNIVVGMLSNSTDGSSTGWSARGTSTSPDYRTIYRYRDNTPIDIDNLSAVSSGLRSTTRPNIQFCFEPKTCPDVTALTVRDITATSATATWEPVGQETSWNVFVSPTQVEDPASIAGYATVNVMTYAMSNLLVDQDYWIYVQPVCTGADSWRVATFRTVATCFPPTALVASDITATTATIAWTDERDVNDYTAIYGPTATFNPADPSTYETADAIDTFAVISNLLPYTNYSFAVRSNCSDMNSRFGAAATFKTAAGVPFEPEFTSTSVPADWSRLTGLASDAFAGTNPTTSTSGWSIIAPDTVIDAYHFRGNIYGTSYKYWVVTPTMEVPAANEGEGYLLRVDLGLTPYSQTATYRDKRNNGVDDKFMIIVQEMTETPVWSAENATVWSNDTTADFIYNEIPENGETYYVDMSKYAGKNIRIAFYGESTTDNADNYFHFGNISLDRAIVNVNTVDACQTDPEEEIGTFTTEEYAPATETSLQIYTKTVTTVYESLHNEEFIETAYVGDHYVDRFYDFYVKLGDEEAYGFEEVSSHGCDSVWLVTFNQILEATTINENDELAESDTINWRGQEITEVGVYTDTVRSAMGGVKEIYILTVTAAVPANMKAAYVKVTADQIDWAGTYIFTFDDMLAHTVIAANNKDFDAAEDAELLIDNNDTILVAPDFADVVIVASLTESSYSLQLPAGNYIAIPNTNAVNASENPADLYFSYISNDDKAGVAIANGADLTNSNTRVIYRNGSYFRGYTNKLTGNLGYILPSLYKYVGLVPEPTPGPVTGIDAITTTEDGAVKVILNGNLYIIRDNQWYDATGRMTVDPRK